MSESIFACGQCGKEIEVVGGQVGRRDECIHCGSELRSCIHCRHYDLTVAKQCKEPFAEVPAAKDRANFCEFFQLGHGGRTLQDTRLNLEKAADALFRK